MNEHWLVLPAASVATQFTIVTPFGKVVPDGGVHSTIAPGQLSPTMTRNVTLEALHWPGSVNRTMLVGQLMTGGSVSMTVTVNTQTALPATFEAVQTTVFVPTGNK